MKSLVKFLNFVKVCLGITVAVGLFLTLGIMGGIENGESFAQGIVYTILSFGLSFASLVSIHFINVLINNIVKKNEFLQMTYYAN